MKRLSTGAIFTGCALLVQTHAGEREIGLGNPPAKAHSRG
jgi:hypothetical protein